MIAARPLAAGRVDGVEPDKLGGKLDGAERHAGLQLSVASRIRGLQSSHDIGIDVEGDPSDGQGNRLGALLGKLQDGGERSDCEKEHYPKPNRELQRLHRQRQRKVLLGHKLSHDELSHRLRVGFGLILRHAMFA
jgi:hypothetical protein